MSDHRRVRTHLRAAPGAEIPAVGDTWTKELAGGRWVRVRVVAVRRARPDPDTAGGTVADAVLAFSETGE